MKIIVKEYESDDYKYIASPESPCENCYLRSKIECCGCSMQTKWYELYGKEIAQRHIVDEYNLYCEYRRLEKKSKEANEALKTFLYNHSDFMAILNRIN